MTSTDTANPQDRTLYGCPSWCTFDHAGDILMEPGDHKRALAKLTDEFGDSVGLYVGPGQPLHRSSSAATAPRSTPLPGSPSSTCATSPGCCRRLRTSSRGCC